MATVKQTYTRESAAAEWYASTPETQQYIAGAYPNLVFYQNLSLLVSIKDRVGSLEDCQRFYNELNDPTSILYARKVHCDAVGISYNFEVIENSET